MEQVVPGLLSSVKVCSLCCTLLISVCNDEIHV